MTTTGYQRGGVPRGRAIKVERSGPMQGHPMPSSEQRADLHTDAVARKQGGSYDPASRTVTMPGRAAMVTPQAGKLAGGSKVFIPDDPSMRIDAGGGEGRQGFPPLTGPMTVGKLTGNVRDRVTGEEMSSQDWDDRYQGTGKPNDWISGGKAFKEREDAAMGIAAGALGEPVQKRNAIGVYTAPGSSKQTNFARRIMTRPNVEQERIGVATNPFMNEGMSDAEVLQQAEGSVLAPATEKVSMGTNFRKPDLAGINNISGFESRNGTLPKGIPYDTRDENTRLVEDLMPGEKKVPGTPNVNTAPGRARKKAK